VIGFHEAGSRQPTRPAASAGITCRTDPDARASAIPRPPATSLWTARRPSRRVAGASRTGSLGRAARALILGLCTASGVPAHAGQGSQCGATGVALQVLGSGGPELQDQRASSSYLIWLDGKPTVLVDAGGGSALRFGQSGATVTPLALILLTHLHADHTSDLPALVKSSFFESREEPLPLYGPTGNDHFPATVRFVKTLFGAPHGAYRYLAAFVSPDAPAAYRLEAHDVTLKHGEIRRIHDTHGVAVFATTVVHGGVPALAYRVEIAGTRIAFSGDTNGDNGSLERLAKDADLLVAHNAVPEGATGVARALHMPPSVIGRIARDAAVKQLILSHRMLRTLGHEDESEANIRTSFAGPIAFANDLDCFPVP
jgi:ribonuclease BN (tRNA processing enzyme)